jgi:hypothetical protein
VQVQRFLGHHKPSFTLDTYVHLLDEDIPEPPIMGAKEGNAGATEGPEIDRNDVATGDAELRMAEPESLAAVRAV